jgi:hypothetical protein
MSRKALITMALLLAAATAATAATALAKEVDDNAVARQVVKSVHAASDAQLVTKVRLLKSARSPDLAKPTVRIVRR